MFNKNCFVKMNEEKNVHMEDLICRMSQNRNYNDWVSSLQEDDYVLMEEVAKNTSSGQQYADDLNDEMIRRKFLVAALYYEFTCCDSLEDLPEIARIYTSAMFDNQD